MTASVLQEVQTFSTATVSSLSVAFADAITAGSGIHAAATTPDEVTYTFSDTNGGSYTLAGTLYSQNDEQQLGHATAVNHAAGATTGTVGFSSAQSYCGVWLREIGGVGTSPLDGTNQTLTPATLSGSCSATNTRQPALWSAICFCPATPNPTATTGTQDMAGWSVGAANYAVSSHERVTSTGAQTAEFEASSTDDVMIVMAMFDEAVVNIVPAPVNSNGHMLMSNGHPVIGEVTKPLTPFGLAMAPLAWVIERRRRRGKGMS